MEREPPENLYRACSEHSSKPDPELTCKAAGYFIGRFVYKLFQSGQLREHMWVKVESAKDPKTLAGLLWNDPVLIKTMKYKDQVEVQISEIERML